MYIIDINIYKVEVRDNGFVNFYKEIMVKQGDDLPEIIKIWRRILKDQSKSDESTMEFAINKFKKKFKFDVQDYNYDDKEYYKYMHERNNKVNNVFRVRELLVVHIVEYNS